MDAKKKRCRSFRPLPEDPTHLPCVAEVLPTGLWLSISSFFIRSTGQDHYSVDSSEQLPMTTSSILTSVWVDFDDAQRASTAMRTTIPHRTRWISMLYRQNQNRWRHTNKYDVTDIERTAVLPHQSIFRRYFIIIK